MVIGLTILRICGGAMPGPPPSPNLSSAAAPAFWPRPQQARVRPHFTTDAKAATPS